MRDRFPLLLIAGLLIAGGLGSLLLKGAKRGAFADRLSTYRSSKGGARALYLLLEGAGVPAQRLQQQLSVIDEGVNPVLLNVRFEDMFSDEDDDENEDDSDSKKSNAFPSPFQKAADGGIDLGNGETEEDLMAALRNPPFRRDESKKLLAHVEAGATVVLAVKDESSSWLLESLALRLTKADDTKTLRTLVPAIPSGYTLGVERCESPVRAWLSLPITAVPLLLDGASEEVAMAMVPYGKGRFIVSTAPELAANQNLPLAHNAQLWVSLATAVAKTGRLGFDEYHHGFSGDRSMGDFLARHGLQFAVAQLLLGLVFWAASLKRFGRVTPPPAAERVGATDALFATSRLYREGNHHAHAAQALLIDVASSLALKAGVSFRTPPVDVVAALLATGQGVWGEKLQKVAIAANTTRTEDDVLTVARLAAELRQQLQHPRKKNRP